MHPEIDILKGPGGITTLSRRSRDMNASKISKEKSRVSNNGVTSDQPYSQKFSSHTRSRQTNKVVSRSSNYTAPEQQLSEIKKFENERSVGSGEN